MNTFTKLISISILGLSLNLPIAKMTDYVSAQTTINFEQIEADILVEMNRARTNPQAYIAELEEFKTYFQGRKIHFPGKTTILTREGIEAVDDAIAYFQIIEPLNPLELSTGMSQAAEDHVKDQGNSGQLGHTGSDGSKPSERMSRYGEWKRQLAENISYGPDTGKQVIMSLIVDDGVYNRGHRKNIMSPLYQVTGIACGDHAQYEVMCVINFAGEYEEK